MVAPLIAAAGISAVGSLVGGATGGKGAKKAAQIQAQSTQQQIAAANANRDYQYGLNQPQITQGAAADERIAGLLNIGGDPSASQAALAGYKDSTGYATRLAEGQTSINTNAYARGMGESGATFKALLKYGQGAASDEFNRYLGQLGGVSQGGAQARGLVAGVGMQTTDMNNGALQTQADASGNAAIVSANAKNQAVQKLFSLGSQAAGGGFGSSFGGVGIAGGGGGGLPSFGGPLGGMMPPSQTGGYGGFGGYGGGFGRRY